MSKKTWTIFSVAFLFTAIGTYNSVVIDARSSLDGSQYTLVKRLDSQGINRPARMVASTVKWEKLRPIVPQKQVAQLPSQVKETPTEEVAITSSIAEDLNLSLVEVINPEKFKDGLAVSDFYGVLTTNGSQIETLDISLPQGLGISISYSEISGNVFEYDMNGETFSGMLYQVDQNAYMVSFTAGELAGTRLRFQASNIMEETMNTSEQVAEVDVGQFGQEGYEMEEMANIDRELQAQSAVGSFNF
ncbi:MAG: hypothetical protein WDA09_03085 [Bacteriovoracaceae bacterium]